ncbi:helix-turn-helix domain-containing protein [Rhodococcus sp. NPDC078407]|uniref:helix-turn-helix domain-containing protein n=1 Tax=Rhodococcus sp. NPDC078407 TaxID=3364509 RepID=UPI0037C6B0A3
MATQWSQDEVQALGVRTDLTTAGQVLGISRAMVYELAKRDELPFPVLRLGRRYVVPVHGLMEALGLPTSQPVPAA